MEIPTELVVTAFGMRAGWTDRRASRHGKAYQVHKYEVGQTVLFTSGMGARASGNGTYRIVRLLPPDGDDFQYRIKSTAEAYERVAKESQLERDR